MEKKRAVFRRTILRRATGANPKRLSDSIVAEEPFTVVWESLDGQAERLASTMRTPGDDLALAAGMLFSEGLVLNKAELSIMSFCAGGGVNELNKLKAELRLSSSQVEARLQHKPSKSTPQSACGMCGLDDLSSPNSLLKWSADRFRSTPHSPTGEVLDQSLQALESECPLFSKTGASHACVIVDKLGGVLSVGDTQGNQRNDHHDDDQHQEEHPKSHPTSSAELPNSLLFIHWDHGNDDIFVRITRGIFVFGVHYDRFAHQRVISFHLCWLVMIRVLGKLRCRIFWNGLVGRSSLGSSYLLLLKILLGISNGESTRASVL